MKLDNITIPARLDSQREAEAVLAQGAAGATRMIPGPNADRECIHCGGHPWLWFQRSGLGKASEYSPVAACGICGREQVEDALQPVGAGHS